MNVAGLPLADEGRHGGGGLTTSYVQPALPEHPLVVLGALGFHDRLSLTCLASPEPATAFS